MPEGFKFDSSFVFRELVCKIFMAKGHICYCGPVGEPHVEK